ncbi:unnamed protein product [Withania somnifera]
MKKDIADHVSKCLNRRRVKYGHRRPSGLMQRLPIPEWKWERVTMDFMSGLPRTSRGFDSIWVIVDRSTKSRHFIPTHSSYNAERPARIYIREVVRLHGVPISIISDRGTRFTLKFWRAVRRDLGTEDMPRACVIDFGGAWDQHLPLAEFAYNNGYHSGIEMAPFEALYGGRCRSSIGWFDGFEARVRSTDLLRDSLNRVRMIQDRPRAAQSRQKSYVDRRLRALEFRVGDKVFLRVSPIRGVMRFGRRGKLSPAFIGPYEILERDSVLDENLSFVEEPVRILAKEVRKLRSREIPVVKVRWSHHSIEEATLEIESEVRKPYPYFIGFPKSFMTCRDR